MAFDVVYNDVTLKNVLTRVFEQEPVRDDSNTDTWYDKFTISVETIANIAIFAAANQIHGITGNRVQGASAAEVCRNIQSRLGEDRKSFQYIQDGTVMVASDIASDANNGPRVVQIKVVPMGRGSMRVQFTIEVSKVSCTENPTPVLGNRWQCVDEIDDDYCTTRSWRGKLRLCNAIHNPQAFRGMVIPQLSDGFRRKRMHFTGELNALELSYEIVDQQLIGDAAPDPAIKMTGTHTETMDKNGATSIGEVYVRLDGPSGTDKHVLLEKCMQIINAKVQADQFRLQKNWRWLELIAIDHFGERVCAVEARARVQRSVETEFGGESLKLGSMILKTFGRSLDLGGNYSRFRTIPPDAYPCTTVGLFACHLQSPCEDNHRMPQASATIDSEESSGSVESEQPQSTYDPTGSQLEIDSPGYSSDHLEAMYTYARVEWIYNVDEGFVALPYGDQLPGSSDTMAFIRLNAPTTKVVAKIASERVGEWPLLPPRARFTDASGIKYVPLKFQPNFRPPEFQGDGRQLYVVDVVAEYGLSRTPGESEFLAPTLPWDNYTETAVPSTVFQNKQ